jgi:putative transposase
MGETMAVENLHIRRSIRLAGYDYCLAGVYFVTMVSHGREEIFGEITDEEMRLNENGKIAEAGWEEIPGHFPMVELGEWVVMPNHVHGIIVINEIVGERHEEIRARHASPQRASPLPVRPPQMERATHASPPRGTPRGSIGAIVGSYKSAVSKRINQLRHTPGAPVWQRNYYDHIIRDEKDWERIHTYISANPAQWVRDEENPERIKLKWPI